MSRKKTKRSSRWITLPSLAHSVAMQYLIQNCSKDYGNNPGQVLLSALSAAFISEKLAAEVERSKHEEGKNSTITDIIDRDDNGDGDSNVR